MGNLLALPPELHEEVAGFLDVFAIANLQRTCRAAHAHFAGEAWWSLRLQRETGMTPEQVADLSHVGEEFVRNTRPVPDANGRPFRFTQLSNYVRLRALYQPLIPGAEIFFRRYLGLPKENVRRALLFENNHYQKLLPPNLQEELFYSQFPIVAAIFRDHCGPFAHPEGILAQIFAFARARLIVPPDAVKIYGDAFPELFTPSIRAKLTHADVARIMVCHNAPPEEFAAYLAQTRFFDCEAEAPIWLVRDDGPRDMSDEEYERPGTSAPSVEAIVAFFEQGISVPLFTEVLHAVVLQCAQYTLATKQFSTLLTCIGRFGRVDCLEVFEEHYAEHIDWQRLLEGVVLGPSPAPLGCHVIMQRCWAAGARPRNAETHSELQSREAHDFLRYYEGLLREHPNLNPFTLAARSVPAGDADLETTRHLIAMARDTGQRVRAPVEVLSTNPRTQRDYTRLLNGFVRIVNVPECRCRPIGASTNGGANNDGGGGGGAADIDAFIEAVETIAQQAVRAGRPVAQYFSGRWRLSEVFPSRRVARAVLVLSEAELEEI